MTQHLRHTAPVFHLEHCDCPVCAPPVPGDRRLSSTTEGALWGLAGIVTGNVIAFAIDPHGAWAALAGAAAQLVGR
ncbi:MAG: hypothetical protein ACRYFW_14385 [Janthinobacterium lividum]